MLKFPFDRLDGQDVNDLVLTVQTALVNLFNGLNVELVLVFDILDVLLYFGKVRG